MSRRPPSKNPYVKARVKAAKSGDKGRRLAVKPPGVKLSKRNGVKSLSGKRRLNGSATSVAERVIHTPRLGLPKGELIPKTPSTYVGRLSCVADWHRQVSKIYREMRRGQIDPGMGTRLTFVANTGASIARFLEEKPPLLTAATDLSRLNDAELEQLELLLAKAAGPAAMERLEQAKPNADWRSSGDE